MNSAGIARYLASGLALLLGACGSVSHQAFHTSATASTSVAPAQSLAALRQRPLNLPALSLGAACPVSESHDVRAVIDAPKGAPDYGYGKSPVYVSGFTDLYPGGWDNGVWLVEPQYTGPVLIRGRQLSGQQFVLYSQPMTFAGSGALPGGPAPGNPATTIQIGPQAVPFYSELDLPAASGSASRQFWRMFFVSTHMDAPGCYGFQVDGLTFTETLIFHVADAARPPA